jgi:hypothetical protein
MNLSEADKEFLSVISKNLGKIEDSIEKNVTEIVEKHPMWEAFFKNIRGIGPKSAGILISTINIHRANTPSALWMYAGLGVVPHVKCTTCGHESWHNKTICQKIKGEKQICGGVTIPIGDERGIQRLVKGEKVGFNKFLKTKLLGVIATNFIRLGSEYRKYYDDYKTRLESKNWGKSKKHRHNAALRYMIKMLLLDVYKVWRPLEGLSVREPYAVEYLGKHGDKKEVYASSADTSRTRNRVVKANKPLPRNRVTMINKNPSV